MTHPEIKSGRGFFAGITSKFSHFGTAVHSKVNSLLGHEGLEVVNPEGGQEDVEAEATRGRFRHEVSFRYLSSSHA
jgi:hypothetical protein